MIDISSSRSSILSFKYISDGFTIVPSTYKFPGIYKLLFVEDIGVIAFTDRLLVTLYFIVFLSVYIKLSILHIYKTYGKLLRDFLSGLKLAWYGYRPNIWIIWNGWK